MFLYFGFLAVIFIQSAISAPISTTSTLVTSILEDENMSKIIQLIPHEQLAEIANDHLKSDENFKAAIKYLQNETFLDLLEKIEKKPQWIAFRDLVKQDTGLDISRVFKCVLEFLRNAKVELTGTADKSFKPFLMDVLKVIPLTDIMGILNSDMNASKFQELYNKMSSIKSKKTVAELIGIPEVKTFLEAINDMDFKIFDLLSFIFGFLKWGEIQIPTTYESILVQLS